MPRENKTQYRVREYNGRFYPERFDQDLGWVGYKHYADFVSFDTESEGWNHIDVNGNALNVSCD